jgi:hypothetical protein
MIQRIKNTIVDRLLAIDKYGKNRKMSEKDFLTWMLENITKMEQEGEQDE